jgi:hypothetical protein
MPKSMETPDHSLRFVAQSRASLLLEIIASGTSWGRPLISSPTSSLYGGPEAAGVASALVAPMAVSRFT